MISLTIYDTLIIIIFFLIYALNSLQREKKNSLDDFDLSPDVTFYDFSSLHQSYKRIKMLLNGFFSPCVPSRLNHITKDLFNKHRFRAPHTRDQ